jgi:transcriptional regulator with XRE-family HTH domain
MDAKHRGEKPIRERMFCRLIGKNLRRQRERHQPPLSQRELGRLAGGMHVNAVSNIERGIYSPTTYTLHRLCRVLGVEASQLLQAVEELEG